MILRRKLGHETRIHQFHAVIFFIKSFVQLGSFIKMALCGLNFQTHRL